MNKDYIPDHVKRIYHQWGEGPTNDQYYEAVAAYFRAQGSTVTETVQEVHNEGRARDESTQ